MVQKIQQSALPDEMKTLLLQYIACRKIAAKKAPAPVRERDRALQSLHDDSSLFRFDNREQLCADNTESVFEVFVL